MNRRLKIGISCYPTYGGSGIVATELGKNLACRGHEVHFITYALPQRLDTFQERVYYHEVKVPEYPLFEYSPYALALASMMADAAQKIGLDLIHAHYAIPHAASAYLAREIISSKLKIITTLHGTDITLVGNEPSFLPIVKFSIEQSDGLTAVSQYLADVTKEEFNIDKPIEVIPNFIDIEYFRKKHSIQLRRRFAMDHQYILMHISNFRAVKRPEDLLQILKRVKGDFDAMLVLVGDGPLRGKLEELTGRMRLGDRVVFLGKQAGIVELLSVADVYVSTSENESFGLSALEAMSCGIPVVATKVGGVPEVINHNSEGFLGKAGDVDTLAESVKTLLGNEELRQEMGGKGRLRAEKCFSSEVVVGEYEDYYLKVLNAKT